MLSSEWKTRRPLEALLQVSICFIFPIVKLVITVFMTLRDKLVYFKLLTPCTVVGYQFFRGPCCLHLHCDIKMEASIDVWNVGILPHCMESQPRRPRRESSPPWKPQISHQFRLFISNLHIDGYAKMFQVVHIGNYRWQEERWWQYTYVHRGPTFTTFL